MSMKTVIYPLTPGKEYILQALHTYRADLDVTSVVIPKVFSQSCVVPTNIEIFRKLEDALPHVECVVFLTNQNDVPLCSELCNALEMQKKVVCATHLTDDVLELAKSTALNYGSSFEYSSDYSLIQELDLRSDVYTQQESVIVAVGAMTQGINTCQAIVEISLQLRDYGFRVGVVGIDNELSLFGFHLLPIDEMIGANLDHTILQINRYFNFFQLTERPNVIVLQLPSEGFYRVSNDYETCFGAKTFLISQAIDIDYCIMITPFIGMDASVFSMLSQISNYRYGFEYNSICIVNKTIDLLISSGTTELRYLVADEQRIHDMVSNLNSHSEGERLFLEFKDDWKKKVAENVIEILSQ